MNILILDNDINICKYFKKMIENIMMNANVIITTCGYEAVNIIGNIEVDLILLTIKTPTEKNDFFFAQRISKASSHLIDIIIISNDDKLAVRSFAIHPHSYFILPLDETMFNRKLQEWLLLREENSLLSQNTVSFEYNDSVKCISLDDIYYIERLNRNIKLVTEKKEYEINDTLKQLSSQLDARFIQTYQSFIVNMDKIRELKIIENRTWRISFTRIDNFALLSRYKSKEFFERFNNR